MARPRRPDYNDFMFPTPTTAQLPTSPLNPTAASSTTPHPTHQSSISSNAPTSRQTEYFETQLHDMERRISQNMQELQRLLLNPDLHPATTVNVQLPRTAPLHQPPEAHRTVGILLHNSMLCRHTT